jgi:hypothetical protein
MVIATCEVCGRQADVNVDTLPETTTVPEAGQRLRCSQCGAKTISTRLPARTASDVLTKAGDRHPLGDRRQSHDVLAGRHLAVGGYVVRLRRQCVAKALREATPSQLFTIPIRVGLAFCIPSKICKPPRAFLICRNR